jgi:hypothetical protein
MVCGLENQCAPQPDFASVGVLTLGGLAAPVAVSPMGTSPSIDYDQILSNLPFPPVTPNAPITLQTGGGDFAPFTLMGLGIQPLALTTTDLVVTRDQPLSLTWAVPDPPGAAQIRINLTVGPAAPPHGDIECDFPDTGSAQIPASLINQLFDLGVSNSAFVNAARVTIDSSTIASGCVEFWVSSPVVLAGAIQ